MNFILNEGLAHFSIEKIKILEAVLELNSTANLAHLPRDRSKLAEFVVLFSW